MVRDGITDLNHMPTQDQSNFLSFYTRIPISLSWLKNNTYQRAESSKSVSLSKLGQKSQSSTQTFYILRHPA